jgi:hypothetical protein
MINNLDDRLMMRCARHVSATAPQYDLFPAAAAAATAMPMTAAAS